MVLKLPQRCYRYCCLIKQIKYYYFVSICKTREPLVLYRSPECWGYAELEQTWKYMSTQCCISCHPYRNFRKQIWPCHKNDQNQPRVIIWKKLQIMGIQPPGTSSDSILELLLFPSFCVNSRKIAFPSLFHSPRGRFLWWKQNGRITLITGCLFQKIALVHSPWAGTDNPLGRKFWCQQKASSLWPLVAFLK